MKEGHGISEGERAPDFTLPESSEVMICLSEEVRKGTVVVLFYPTDFGITCTMEFKRFKEMLHDFKAAGASLIGISVNSTISHRAWKDKMGMDIPLLSDMDGKVVKAYNVMSADSSLLKGKSTRAVFIIDSDQRIRYCWVPADQHTQPDYEVTLKQVQGLRSSNDQGSA